MAKILVIEDDELILNNILELLDAEEYETLKAENGLEGVNIARKELPDLILCDIMMPELDGYGVFQELQSETLTAEIPFIFLTAMSEKKDFRKGMSLGADDYLTKPFTRKELLEAIATRIQKRENIM